MAEKKEQTRGKYQKAPKSLFEHPYHNADDVAKYIWDADEWSRCFAIFTAKEHVQSSKIKAARVLVQTGTVEACRRREYALPDGSIVALDNEAMKKACLDSCCFKDNHEYKLSARDFDTEVFVQGGDCLELALALKAKGLSPAVLNMASRTNPGGGWKHGSGAQEENLHRRTSLYKCLADPERIDRRRSWSYPLPEFGGVYSPDVLVFREAESRGYAFMQKPVPISFLTVAGTNTVIVLFAVG